MRTREVERLRRRVGKRLKWQSLRSLARQMQISHYALRCFVSEMQSVRTTEQTIAKIRDGLYTDPPSEFVLRWLKDDLRLLHSLTDRDIYEILADVERRLERTD